MKVASASRLEVDPASRPGFVMLTEWWHVELGEGRCVCIPRGFWCDGASIPALIRPWLHPLVLLGMGVAHDFAVRPGAAIWTPTGAEPFTLATATELAVALAEHAGVGRTKRWCIAAALRIAVRTYWHQRPMDWTPVHDS